MPDDAIRKSPGRKTAPPRAMIKRAPVAHQEARTLEGGVAVSTARRNPGRSLLPTPVGHAAKAAFLADLKERDCRCQTVVACPANRAYPLRSEIDGIPTVLGLLH
jgi:hypothetical protein